jgi:hypothetical protein
MSSSKGICTDTAPTSTSMLASPACWSADISTSLLVWAIVISMVPQSTGPPMLMARVMASVSVDRHGSDDEVEVIAQAIADAEQRALAPFNALVEAHAVEGDYSEGNDPAAVLGQVIARLQAAVMAERESAEKRGYERGVAEEREDQSFRGHVGGRPTGDRPGKE